MKAYFGIRKDGTPDVKGVTAIKSNSPSFIQNVFRDCVREMADVKNQAHYVEAKGRVQRVVRNAIEDLKGGKVPLEDLEYQVEVHEDRGKEGGKGSPSALPVRRSAHRLRQASQEGCHSQFCEGQPLPVSWKNLHCETYGTCERFS